MSRCPNSIELERLLDEQPGEESEVALHIEGCVRCQAALEQLTANASLLVPLTATRAVGVE